MCLSGGKDPVKPSACGAVAPCATKVKGTPVAIPPGDDSIVCKGGTLVVQNHFPPGPEHDCTQAHEESHIKDWKERYGEDLCKGVADGQLPLGGDGYDEFINQSECKAYKIGKACREGKVGAATGTDKAQLEAGIKRDEDQLKSRGCK